MSGLRGIRRFLLPLFGGGSGLLLSLSLLAQHSHTPSIAPYFKKPGIDDNSSFCYVHRDKEYIDGQNIKSKVKIASVSKLFTSYYVLKSVGPQFRFKTHFFYDKETHDLYIYGSRDPFMGQRTLQFIVSELNKLGIRNVRTLYFDEHFSVYLDVEVAGPQMWNDNRMPSEVRYHGRSQRGTKKDLRFFFTQLRKNYLALKASAEKQGIQMAETLQMRVSDIVPLGGESSPQKPVGIAYEYVSAPVLQYLKSLNVHSNNYVADELVAAFGGIEKMNQFLTRDLGFSESDFEFYTGSGLWKNSPEIPGSNSLRTVNSKDNLATCEAVMNVLFGLERVLMKFELKMSDLVMVASQDRGSLTLYKIYKSDELNNAVMAKTGTLNQAAALAGEISAESGEFFFGIFFQTENRTATTRATVYRDQIIRQLMKEVGGGKDPIIYKPQEFFPFDSNSALRLMSDESKPAKSLKPVALAN